MRLISEIPHSRYKIQVFHYNSKYIIKIELGQFEQVYKIGELDVLGLDEVKEMVNDVFLKKCLDRFVAMRSDWEESFKGLNSIK